MLDPMQTAEMSLVVFRRRFEAISEYAHLIQIPGPGIDPLDR